MARYGFFILILICWQQASGQQNLQLLSPDYNNFFSEINSELWIASAGKGYNRYRGIDTKHYILNDSVSGLKGTFIQSSLFQDNSGLLWTSTFEYICYFDPSEDRFFCDKIVVNRDTIENGYHVIEFDKANSSLLIRANDQLLTYDTKIKKVRTILGNTKGNFFKTWQDTIAGAPWMNSEGLEFWIREKDTWKKKLISLEECKLLSGRKIIKVIHTTGHIWLLTDDGLILFNRTNKCLSQIFKYNHSEKNIITDGLATDSILWLSSRKNGVLLFDIKKLQFISKPRIERERVDVIFKDRFERFWFAQANNGIEIHYLFKLKPDYQNPGFKSHWSGAFHEHGIDALIDQDNGVMILHKGSKKLLKTNTKLLPLSTLYCVAILDSQRILLCDRFVCYTYDIVNKHSKKVDLSGVRQIQNIRVHKDRLYVVADKHLSIFNTRNFKSIIDSGYNKYQGTFQKPLSVTDHEVLFSLSSSQLLIKETNRDTIINIGAFIQAGLFNVYNQKCYIGANDGLYILDKKNKLYNITKLHPLLANETVYDLQMDDRWVYFNTKNKLCRISFDLNHIDISDKETFEFQPSFALKNHSIIVGSDIPREKEKDYWFDSQNYHLLALDYVKVNDMRVKNDALINLKYKQNKIIFRYYINDEHHPEENKILYRLKQSIDTLWRTIANGDEILFENLSPGVYNLEIKGLKSNGSYTPVYFKSFTIKPPWFKTLWFGVFLTFSFVLLVYSLFNYRIKQLKKQYLVRKEISDLERSALQAQMNPHFIFNCLNSIQNYIMRNDKDLAMDYLGRFATLIRQYLNASTKDLVTLDDEISMLTTYLNLEQMRFNKSFEYHFQVDNNLDTVEITLPPLLIQPFVENAILHGMTSIKNGGKIMINFSKKENQLQITIKDNGKGFDKNKNTGMSRSLGISITQKRLQYINDHAEGNYNISTQSDENGTEIGITLKI